jgi:cytidine deaminase
MGPPWEQLFAAATRARENAYAPYSKFKVGAAVMAEDGAQAEGCNVENAAWGPSVCAERNAISALVVQGKEKLAAVAIVVDSNDPTPPCGVCRQVMAEFAGPELPVVCRNLAGVERRYTLGELLPHAFTNRFL